jgi:hypothetical protein
MIQVLLLSLLHSFPALAADPIDRGCHLPVDQGMGSLHTSWSQLPIKLTFDSEFYVADGGMEARALERAVQTWNDWAKAKGKVAFVIERPGQGSGIPELEECAQASYTEAHRSSVGVWKINGSGFRANRRPSCGAQPNGSPGKLLPFGVQGSTDWIVQNGKTAGASILLNFEDYNAPGKQRIDTESLMLHHLGHVLGLLHSCNGSNGDSMDATTAPACFDRGMPSAPADYLRAAMFPYLEVSEQKRALGQNDIDRASCLY